MKQYFVYIITNKTNSTLYTGVTSDLVKRIYEHKDKVVPGFSSKYNLSKLVYYEVYDTIDNAIEREKQIKKWRRSKKDFLINTINPFWSDMYSKLV